MICPFCGSGKTRVTNTRLTKKETETWRRRLCEECGESYTTYEIIDLSYLKVVKKDGRRVFFNRAKLYSGIYQATLNLKGVDRGDMGMLAEKMTELVEKKILLMRTKEITTRKIYQIACESIKGMSIRVFWHYTAYFGEDKKGGLV